MGKRLEAEVGSLVSEERPPLRIVISDPRAGGKVIRVRVKGVEDIEYTDEMRKTREQERRVLPIARISKTLAEKLSLGPASVITLRFRTSEGKTVKIPFKAVVADNIEEGEVQVNLELLGEAVGEIEAEAEAFRAKSWQVAVSDDVAIRLAGLEIGDEFDGSMVGLEGVRLKVRGGSDATGFPMHPGVPGSGKYRALLSGPPGFRPREKGERRRKTVRGRMIPDPRGERRKTALAQLNVVISYPES